MKHTTSTRSCLWSIAFCLLCSLSWPACSDDDTDTPPLGDAGEDPSEEVDIGQDPVSDPYDEGIVDATHDAVVDAGDTSEDPRPEVIDVACGEQATLPECETTSPSPTTTEGIQDFAASNAIPLRCAEDGRERWEFDILVDQFEGMRVFVMGEVHGSNEIGAASADLFEVMATQGVVDTLVIEIGMDVTDALDEYVETGEGPFIDLYGYEYYNDDMFRRALPDRARQLYLEETPVRVVGVDSPQRLAWVNEQIHEIADDLTDETVQGLILDTLPRPREMDSYPMLGIERAYITAAEQYHQHIADNLETICALLEEADCERLEWMALALYVGAVFNSADLMMAMLSAGDELTPELIAWLDDREELIFWNFQQAIPSGDERVYAHMGALHAAKTGTHPHVAGLLNSSYAPTEGMVYTTTPAYGPGSQVFYTIITEDVPPEPALIADVLAAMPVDNYFLATRCPGLDCTENPFLTWVGPAEIEGAPYGDAYDAFFWFWRLTPDVPEGGIFKGADNDMRTWAHDNLSRTRQADRLLSRASR